MKHVPAGGGEVTPYQLVKQMGLEFIDQTLLARAFTHRSYLNEHPDTQEDNERLEFLGDAVLDFLSGAWLYNQYPTLSEGELTRMRSALVRTEQLAEFARSLGLGDALRLGQGEIIGKGRERDLLLCATFEAFIGALFLDQGVNATQHFVSPFFAKAAVSFLQRRESLDPKSHLQEWTQAKHYGIPEYVTVQASGPDHDRQYVVEVRIKDAVYGQGTGHSKATAARAAAQKALEFINSKKYNK